MKLIDKKTKKKIFEYILKNCNTINFSELDKNKFFSKIKEFNYFDSAQIFNHLSDIFLKQLNLEELYQVKSIDKISSLTKKIEIILTEKLKNDFGIRNEIKKIFFEIVKQGHVLKLTKYFFDISNIVWIIVKDQSTDFNYYTKRFSLISVYLKILCVILLKEKFQEENIQKEVSKTLEQLKYFTKLKSKFSIFEDIQKFFSQFKTQQGRGF